MDSQRFAGHVPMTRTDDGAREQLSGVCIVAARVVGGQVCLRMVIIFGLACRYLMSRRRRISRHQEDAPRLVSSELCHPLPVSEARDQEAPVGGAGVGALRVATGRIAVDGDAG